MAYQVTVGVKEAPGQTAFHTRELSGGARKL